MTFHVNPANGGVGKCAATQGNCPFGGDDGSENHFATKEEAYNGAMALLASRYGSFSVHSQNSRLEEALFNGDATPAQKKELLKEYLANNEDEVLEVFEENGISGEGQEPGDFLAYASDRTLEAALAQAAVWKADETYYESPADVFVALAEEARQAEYEEAHAYYQAQRAARGLPPEGFDVDDAYSDDPAKAMGMRAMMADAMAEKPILDPTATATYAEIMAMPLDEFVCPQCKAGKGEECRTRSGNPTQPHNARLRTFWGAAAEAKAREEAEVRAEEPVLDITSAAKGHFAALGEDEFAEEVVGSFYDSEAGGDEDLVERYSQALPENVWGTYSIRTRSFMAGGKQVWATLEDDGYDGLTKDEVIDRMKFYESQEAMNSGRDESIRAWLDRFGH